MTMPKQTPAQLLALVVQLAPELRKAGATRVEIPGVLVLSLEPEEAVVPKQLGPREVENLSPLDDPDTFNGIEAPGYPALKRTREENEGRD